MDGGRTAARAVVAAGGSARGRRRRCCARLSGPRRTLRRVGRPTRGRSTQPHHCVICHSIRSFRTALADCGPAAVNLTAEHGVDACADRIPSCACVRSAARPRTSRLNRLTLLARFLVESSRPAAGLSAARDVLRAPVQCVRFLSGGTMSFRALAPRASALALVYVFGLAATGGCPGCYRYPAVFIIPFRSKPIADATVAIEGTALETKSGPDGSYSIPNVPAGASPSAGDGQGLRSGAIRAQRRPDGADPRRRGRSRTPFQRGDVRQPGW